MSTFLDQKMETLKNLPASHLIKSEADINENLPWYVRFSSKILTSTNSTPKHIAFIMDGNRRYAKTKLNTQNVLQGHNAGFNKLIEILVWCRLLKIRIVSVYAFSIENFKRSDHEVGGLFKIFEEKLLELASPKNLEKLKENRIKIKFVGEIDRLPGDFKSRIDQITNVNFGEGNEAECTLNICLAYTSRNEIVNAVDKSIEQEQERDDFYQSDSGLAGTTSLEQFRESFEQCLMIQKPFPDIMIRTSGETRLSDFMLYQCFEKTRMEFIDCLWPEMGYFDFLKCVLNWQVFN